MNATIEKQAEENVTAEQAAANLAKTESEHTADTAGDEPVFVAKVTVLKQKDGTFNTTLENTDGTTLHGFGKNEVANETRDFVQAAVEKSSAS